MTDNDLLASQFPQLLNHPYRTGPPKIGAEEEVRDPILAFDEDGVFDRRPFLPAFPFLSLDAFSEWITTALLNFSARLKDGEKRANLIDAANLRDKAAKLLQTAHTIGLWHFFSTALCAAPTINTAAALGSLCRFRSELVSRTRVCPIQYSWRVRQKHLSENELLAEAIPLLGPSVPAEADQVSWLKRLGELKYTELEEPQFLLDCDLCQRLVVQAWQCMRDLGGEDTPSFPADVFDHYSACAALDEVVQWCNKQKCQQNISPKISAAPFTPLDLELLERGGAIIPPPVDASEPFATSRVSPLTNPSDLRSSESSLSNQFLPSSDPSDVSDSTSLERCPRWDKDRRQLYFGSYLCKQYRQPAEQQELILDAFEEENWPAKIDNPIPPKSGSTNNQHVRDAVRRLNENEFIRFALDGTTEGILWEPRRREA